MNHSSDCRIHDDASVCDCGVLAARDAGLVREPPAMADAAPKDNEVDEKVTPVAWIVTNGGESCEPWLEYEQSEVDALPAVCIAEPLYSAATVAELRAEVERLNAIVNTPQANDFLRAVSTEAEHQRQRWGSDHDAGKTPADWFWLVGYLAGKALHAHGAGDTTKAEHHIITTAAALANWHLSMFGKTDMRPGIDGEAALTGADPT